MLRGLRSVNILSKCSRMQNNSHPSRFLLAQTLSTDQKKLKIPSGKLPVFQSVKDELEILTSRIRDYEAKFPTKSKPKLENLEPRTMSDSQYTVCIPITDENSPQRTKYLNAVGGLRIGRLLEDIDYMAVYVCYLHNRKDLSNDDPAGSVPRSIVTAGVDRIGIDGDSLKTRDVFLQGHVTWVGNSSMEAVISVLQEDDNGVMQCPMKCNFIMASRTSDGRFAVPIHPLNLTSEKERKIFQDGVEANKARRIRPTKSLLVSPPTEEEFVHLHSLFQQQLPAIADSSYTTQLKENQISIANTVVRNTFFCYPQHRNVYGKLFGGFIMREAQQVATMAAKFVVQGHVHCISIDDISFKRPVEIGNLVECAAKVTYSEGNMLQVRVLVTVMNDLCRDKKTSNKLHFTYVTADGGKVPQIVPHDYSSGLLYLNGRRKLKRVIRHLEHEKQNKIEANN